MFIYFLGRPNRPIGQWQDRNDNVPVRGHRLPGPYLPEADRKYWDELYTNGPQAYYDKKGNPLPGMLILIKNLKY